MVYYKLFKIIIDNLGLAKLFDLMERLLLSRKYLEAYIGYPIPLEPYHHFP